MPRAAWIVGIATLGVIGGGALYAHARAAPACEDQRTLAQVYAILRDQFHLDSLLLNNVNGIEGGYFSHRRECTAQVTEIRGNIAASDMPWRDLRFAIAPDAGTARFVVTATLGGRVTLAEPQPSLWRRLLDRF